VFAFAFAIVGDVAVAVAVCQWFHSVELALPVVSVAVAVCH